MNKPHAAEEGFSKERSAAWEGKAGRGSNGKNAVIPFPLLRNGGMSLHVQKHQDLSISLSINLWFVARPGFRAKNEHRGACRSQQMFSQIIPVRSLVEHIPCDSGAIPFLRVRMLFVG